MRLLTLLLALTTGCEAPEVDARDASSPAVAAVRHDGATPTAHATDSTPAFLDGYDFEDRVLRFDLPGRLDEVSGLAFSPDGRLFAHDDERGRVHLIDPAAGEVGKRFDLGEDLVREDFEGIAIVGERFFLITSTGLLYEFREGEDRENMQYRRTDTGVGANCEVEGLDWEPVADELLVACKVSTPNRDEFVVHRIPIAPDRARPPALRVPMRALEAFGLPADFAPSAIAVAPTGSWLLLSGQDDALIEVDPADGRVLAAVPLRKGRHPQSEGLAIGPDGLLYISDEKNGKEPRLTAYGPR